MGIMMYGISSKFRPSFLEWYWAMPICRATALYPYIPFDIRLSFSLKNLAVKRLTKLPMIMATPNSHELKKIPMIITSPEIELFMKATSPMPLSTESMTRIASPCLSTQFFASGMVDTTYFLRNNRILARVSKSNFNPSSYSSSFSPASLLIWQTSSFAPNFCDNSLSSPRF